MCKCCEWAKLEFIIQTFICIFVHFFYAEMAKENKLEAKKKFLQWPQQPLNSDMSSTYSTLILYSANVSQLMTEIERSSPIDMKIHLLLLLCEDEDISIFYLFNFYHHPHSTHSSFICQFTFSITIATADAEWRVYGMGEVRKSDVRLCK